MSVDDKRRFADAISWIAFVTLLAVGLFGIQPQLLLSTALGAALVACHVYLLLIRCPHCGERFRSQRRGTTEARRIKTHCPNCNGDLREP